MEYPICMGWSMNELYLQLYSASIMGSYNITGKIKVFLIKIAQKYSNGQGIFKYTELIFEKTENDYGNLCDGIRIIMRHKVENMNKS